MSPPWPWAKTAGVPSMGSDTEPSDDTVTRSPGSSVTSIRPSGRKARPHGVSRPAATSRTEIGTSPVLTVSIWFCGCASAGPAAARRVMGKSLMSVLLVLDEATGPRPGRRKGSSGLAEDPENGGSRMGKRGTIPPPRRATGIGDAPQALSRAERPALTSSVTPETKRASGPARKATAPATASGSSAPTGRAWPSSAAASSASASIPA